MDGNGTCGGRDGSEGAALEALEALRFSWGCAYWISADGDGDGFRARRRDGKGSCLEAVTPGELAAMIREDYAACPVLEGRLPEGAAVIAAWDNVGRRAQWVSAHPGGDIRFRDGMFTAFEGGEVIAVSADLGRLMDRLDYLGCAGR